MRVKYVGMFDEVLVPDAGMLVAKRNHLVEVPDDVAAGLLAQGAPQLEDGSYGPGTEWVEAPAKSPVAAKADDRGA